MLVFAIFLELNISFVNPLNYKLYKRLNYEKTKTHNGFAFISDFY